MRRGLGGEFLIFDCEKAPLRGPQSLKPPALPGDTYLLLTGEGSRLLDAAMQLARSLGIYVLGALCKPLDPAELREMLESYEPRICPQPGCAASSLSYAPAELADAIEQDQLILHYQPQVRPADGKPSSIECLGRWRTLAMGWSIRSSSFPWPRSTT